MIKASEGGGGKGIRKVLREEDLALSFDSVRGEVPGSPIFLMRMVSNCHHLEVQVVGDEHGNAISIYGRDCSIQRRHQKIIEEGPAVAADPNVWREMERGAVRLAKAVNYVGAGTVEYLYADGGYYFLELNPRLQVEHPVSERISNVNLPATQLNVAMGIPLSNIPCIRRMYGFEPLEVTPIDLDNIDQVSTIGHCIACRITAENPEEGFKPSSGNVRELTFRSTPNVWGYFSIQGRGSLHEFADSQFGHLFSWGETRDLARRNMIVALKEVSIRGDIRTPVEYLVNLLETEDFQNNTVHTGWLDKLLESKTNFNNKPDPIISVLCGAAYRAHELSKSRHDVYIQYIERGQVPPVESLKNTEKFELIYNDIKYKFKSRKFGNTTYYLSTLEKEVEIDVSSLSDDGLLVVIDGTSYIVYGEDEPAGLRLSIKGKNVVFPTEYDPSNLKSTTAGKLVRYLVQDGSFVKAGTPFAEVEVMKMYMALNCPENGVIHFKLNAGSVLVGGETIATLDLENPNAVKQCTPYKKDLPDLKPPYVPKDKLHQKLRYVLEHMNYVLAGYQSDKIQEMVNLLIEITSDPRLPLLEFNELLSILSTRLPEEITQKISQLISNYGLNLQPGIAAPAFPAQVIASTIKNYSNNLDSDSSNAFNAVVLPILELSEKYEKGYLKEIVSNILDRYLNVETLFQNRQRDDVFTELRQIHKNDLEEIFAISLSRSPESKKQDLILYILESIVQKDIEKYVDKLHVLSTLVIKDSIEISVKARQLLIRYQMPSFKQRQVAIEECLRTAIATPKRALDELSTLLDQPAAVFDVLVSFFKHSNEKVRNLALEVYIRRCYRAYDIKQCKVSTDDVLRLEWQFNTPQNIDDDDERCSSPILHKVESVDNFIATQDAEVQGAEGFPRYGLLVAFDTLKSACDQIEPILEYFNPPRTHVQQEPINILKICILNDSEMHQEQAIICNIGQFFHNYSSELRSRGIRRITLLFARGTRFPEYYTFREKLNYQEDPVIRHIEPPLAYHMEIDRLSNFDITYVPTVNRQLHLYYGTAKGTKRGDPDFTSSFFVRAIIRSPDSIVMRPVLNDVLVSQAERLLVDAIKSLEVAVRDRRYSSAQNHHIFLRVINEVNYEPESVDHLLRTLGETYGRRLWKLRVGKLELAGKVKQGSSVSPLRFIVTNPTGYDFEVEGYLEARDAKKKRTILSSFLGKGQQDGKSITDPYPLPNMIERKRFWAQNHGTTYCYDFPALYKVAIQAEWEKYQEHCKQRGEMVALPNRFIKTKELCIVNGKLEEVNRPEGSNTIGMVAWKATLYTPEAPEGRKVIIIANDITVLIGSFGPEEDLLFMKASEKARKEGIPRIYIACNSGARIGLAREVKDSFDVKWKDSEDPTKGFEYLRAPTEKIEELLNDGSILIDNNNGDNRITDIIGKEDGLGVENLRGSGMIAGETSRAYEDIFTVTHVTGRTVGIGAYLVRLGQRTVQTEAPIILTGASAINKLLGKEVYSSNSQLGGIQVMFRNGVSHLDVTDDYKGTQAIVNWLSYVPLKAGLQGPILDTKDPIEREIEFEPTKQPYDVHHMLAGYYSDNGKWISGFFDEGSFMETLAGWAKTVICGRARLGGIPIGVIAVETRTVENVIPADPANPESQEQIQMQAGQVWFPDSAYKTAQAINDFNYGEGLPLMIFANWRGFSGGMRDMYNEILKYGSYIVDNLRKYKQPVLIYIPPYGELRGGAWVVLDPTINPDRMEMYCDSNGRGGVLEPTGTVEIKFRKKDVLITMHRIDKKLIELDEQLDAEMDEQQQQVIKTEISLREGELYPVYEQIAIQFAELHDTPGRMKAKNVINEEVQWKKAREYFYYRLRRLLAEDRLRDEISKAKPGCTHDEQTNIIKSAATPDNWECDKKFVDWASSPNALSSAINELRSEYIKAQIMELYKLDPTAVQNAINDLKK